MRLFKYSALVLSLTALLGCNDSHQDEVESIKPITAPTLVGFAKLDVKTYAEGPDSVKDVKGANGIFPMFKG